MACTGEEVGRGVCEVFAELCKELRQLKDLPLAITSLQGTSPVFRHTEVWKERGGEGGRVGGEREGNRRRREEGRKEGSYTPGIGNKVPRNVIIN